MEALYIIIQPTAADGDRNKRTSKEQRSVFSIPTYVLNPHMVCESFCLTSRADCFYIKTFNFGASLLLSLFFDFKLT